METRDDQPALFSLRDVTVRPVRCVAERRRWDTLVSEHHYLPFSGLFGKALRHVAVVGDLWLALIDVCATRRMWTPPRCSATRNLNNL